MISKNHRCSCSEPVKQASAFILVSVNTAGHLLSNKSAEEPAMVSMATANVRMWSLGEEGM